MSTAPDPLEPAWQRLRSAAERVVEAADGLDEAGGLRRLAGSMSDKARSKALASLQEARRCLDGQIAQIKTARPVAPPRRSPGGPPRRRVESPGRPGPATTGPTSPTLADRVAEWARDMTEFDPD